MERKAGRLARFVRAIGDSAVYVGIDVHKKTYSVALFCPDRNLTEGYVCPADEAGLAEQLRGLGCVIVHVVYESGPTGFSLARRLIDAGFCASVVAASRIPRVSAAVAKTDRIDAAKLAIYSARGLLRAIAPRRFPRRWRFPSSPDEPSRASPQGSAMRQEQSPSLSMPPVCGERKADIGVAGPRMMERRSGHSERRIRTSPDTFRPHD